MDAHELFMVFKAMRNEPKNDIEKTWTVYRFDIPVLIIKEEHGLEGHASPPMNSLEMVCLVGPTGEYFLHFHINQINTQI